MDEINGIIVPMLTDTQRQENIINNSWLKRIVLILALAVAISGALDPAIYEELESSLNHSRPGFNAIQTIGLRFSRDCINTNAYRSNDQGPVFGSNIRDAEYYSSHHYYGKASAFSGSNANYYTLSLLLNIGSIICLLSLFHIYYIHLQDGKK